MPTPAVRKPGSAWAELPQPGRARPPRVHPRLDRPAVSEKFSTLAARRPELEAAVKLAGEIRSTGVAVTLVVHEHKCQ
ncbi:hypothetical protein [Streptomyces sp. NBC_00207]|uniref:hypothetical protein n=1 Tax=Streptomyces sp. NBC_00207 TaxID=2903635 RepID=UPI0032484D57